MNNLLKDIKACIRDTARKAKVRLSTRDLDDQYNWNGKTIATREWCKRLRPDANIIHDIAHYIVASNTRRKLPEFGLGTSPDNSVREANQILSHKGAQHEEEEVSLLGILIEKQLGLRPLMTFTDHSWESTDDTLGSLLKRYRNKERDTSGCKALRRLQQKGHLDDNLMPVVLS